MTDTSSGKILAQTDVIASKGTSAWSLFWEADFFVQLIMLGLLAASVWSWTLIFYKIREFLALQRSTKKILQGVANIHSLSKLQEFLHHYPTHILSRVVNAGLNEKTHHPHSHEGKKIALELFGQTLDGTLRLEINRLQSNSNFLATVGSTAPFIGLLGTVWGIMHSFQSIALSQNTSLAVVAPGIAEALAATALGLIAAIPAVVAYNRINAFLNNYTQLAENFIDKACALYAKELY